MSSMSYRGQFRSHASCESLNRAVSALMANNFGA